jgi:hypothetical protein
MTTEHPSRPLDRRVDRDSATRGIVKHIGHLIRVRRV